MEEVPEDADEHRERRRREDQPDVAVLDGPEGGRSQPGDAECHLDDVDAEEPEVSVSVKNSDTSGTAALRSTRRDPGPAGVDRPQRPHEVGGVLRERLRTGVADLDRVDFGAIAIAAST